MDSGGDRRIASLIATAKQSARYGRSHEAEQLMRQAEREGPRHPLVLHENAARLLRSGDADGATAILDHLVQVDGGNSEIWFNYAVALRKLGRTEDAAAALDKALEIEPRNAIALIEKGSLEESLDKPRAAAMSYRTALH